VWLLCVWIDDAAAERRVFGLFREIAVRLGLRRENGRYQREVQALLGLLSRLHVLAGIGLRRAVEAQAGWKRKEACNSTSLLQQADT